MGEIKNKPKLNKFSSEVDSEVLSALITEIQQLEATISNLQREQALHNQNAEFEKRVAEKERDAIRSRLSVLENQVQNNVINLRAEMKEMQKAINDDLEEVEKEEAELREAINSNIRKILWAVLGTVITYLVSKYL